MSLIAIQGFEGSFHHEAVWKYFGKQADILPCSRFSDLVHEVMHTNMCTGGMMAIENSIAGSILPNYLLLQKNAVTITGEVYLPIKQQLLVNKGVSIEDIKEVHSHPMALLQCTNYLAKLNVKLVETEDTALSAAHIARYKSKHTAAIASKIAAELFGLAVIAPNTQDEKKNYTRFLVLQKKQEASKPELADKASINFSVAHSQGSLAKVLTILASCDINLSKLQSIPIAGTAFEYSFIADLEFDALKQLEMALLQLEKHVRQLSILGTYKKGVMPI